MNNFYLASSRAASRNSIPSLCANGEYETTLIPYVPPESEIKFGEHKPNSTSNQSPKSQPVFSEYDTHFTLHYPNFNDIHKRIETVKRTDSLANQDGPSNSTDMQEPEIGTDMISKLS